MLRHLDHRVGLPGGAGRVPVGPLSQVLPGPEGASGSCEDGRPGAVVVSELPVGLVQDLAQLAVEGIQPLRAVQ
jgi:hypothetical protein